MAAMDQAVKQYNLSFMQKFMTKTGHKVKFLREKFKDVLEDETLKLKKLDGKHLIDVQNGGLPDEVNWMNIKYNSKNRCVRKIIIWLIALVLILIAFTFMVYLKNIGLELK